MRIADGLPKAWLLSGFSAHKFMHLSLASKPWPYGR